MGIPDLLSETEEDGFLDLVFGIMRESGFAGRRLFDVQAAYHRERVGLLIELSDKWTPCTIGDIPSSRGTITYRSSGTASDKFLSLLDELYGVNLRPHAMRDAVTFTAITLGGDICAIESEVTHMKLFYEREVEVEAELGDEDGEDDAYAEIYTNFDLPRGIVQIREKDEGYRVAIIRALAQPAETLS